MAVFDPRGGKPLAPHGGTFNANPVSMIAGTVAMELMTPDEFTRLNTLGQRIRDGIADAFTKTGIDGQVTGDGSLFRILMTSAPLVDYRTAQAANAQASALARVLDFLRTSGILIANTGLGALSTPMGEGEVDLFVEIFAAALEQESAHQ
jgi:glutamate-1-semialdehyde 2,1-aminomutase